MVRWVWNTLGLASVGVGIAGAFLPVLPTTVFLIIGLWCFSKGSPRLERWLLNHKVYGGTLRRWRATKGVTLRGKYCAVAAITVSVLASSWFVRERMASAITVVVLGAAGVAYVLSRPTDQGEAIEPYGDRVA